MSFAIRLINDDLAIDTAAALPVQLSQHNQALLEFFCTIQEAGDDRMESSQYAYTSPLLLLTNSAHIVGQSKLPVVVGTFLKQEEPFCILPTVSPLLFPQFKGPSGTRAVGVMRPKNQHG